MDKKIAKRGVVAPKEDQTQTLLDRLKRAADELSEAGWFFDRLGVDSLTERCYAAAEEAEDIQEILEVLLGRVELVLSVGPDEAEAEPAKKPAKPRAKKPAPRPKLVKAA